MKKDTFEDDGRTICNMDVDGMPPSGPGFPGYKAKGDIPNQTPAWEEKMTRSESRRYTWYAVLAGLTVTGVVGGGTVLFIFILWLLWR